MAEADPQCWRYRLWCPDCDIHFLFYSEQRRDDTTVVNGQYQHNCGTSMHRFCLQCYQEEEPFSWHYRHWKEEYDEHLIGHFTKKELQDLCKKFGFPAGAQLSKMALFNQLQQADKGSNHNEPEEKELDRLRVVLTENQGKIYRSAEIQVRQYQSVFRQYLLLERHEKCEVSGCQIPEMLQAAHVDGWESGNEPENGLLLRADLHLLYDSYLWSINNQGEVEFATRFMNRLSDADKKFITEPCRKTVLPHMKNNKFRKSHYKKFQAQNK